MSSHPKPPHPAELPGSSDRQGGQNFREVLIRGVADAFGGHIRRDQLHELGVSDSAIAHLVRRGFLIRVHRGVYAVGHLPRQPLDRAHAALLLVGDRSALCLGSAGSYWGVFKTWWFPLHVTSPADHRPKGVISHQWTTLSRGDIHRDPDNPNLRVTSAARTALDLCSRMKDRPARRMIRGLRLGRHTTLADLQSVLERNPMHPGSQRLRTVLLGSQRNPTRSDLEEIFLEIVRRYGLPVPVINERLNGCRVDFYFPGHNLIVEVDGPVTHRDDPEQWSEDRRRDRENWITGGTTTIRFTYDDCYDTPEMVADTVQRALNRESPVPAG